MLQMNSGKILSGSPCIGSWVNYGLGTVNQNLPGFCVMLDPTGGPISGAKNWTSGYMPASYQGTILRGVGQPILDLQRPQGVTDPMQRRMLDTLNAFNRVQFSGPNTSVTLAPAFYRRGSFSLGATPDVPGAISALTGKYQAPAGDSVTGRVWVLTPSGPDSVSAHLSSTPRTA